jgi:hypothetical protein
VDLGNHLFGVLFLINVDSQSGSETLIGLVDRDYFIGQ